MGPAILYLPNGFREGGVAFSIPMLLLSYFLFTWGVACLLDVWAIYKKSYPGLVGKAYGPAGATLDPALIPPPCTSLSQAPHPCNVRSISSVPYRFWSCCVSSVVLFLGPGPGHGSVGQAWRW